MNAHPAVRAGPGAPWRSAPAAATAAAVLALSLVAAAAVALAGPIALLLATGAALVPVALARPRETFWMAAACAIIVDTAPVGPSAPFTLAFWELPSSVLALMPFKMNPFEIVVLLAAAGSALRPSRAVGTASVLVRLAPIVLLLGFAWGIAEGGAVNLAYHEARGLIFGSLAFFVVWRTGGLDDRHLARWFMAATGLLGIAVAYRFAVDLRGGAAGPPKEFWFGHETGLFLAAGAIAGVLALSRVSGHRERTMLVLYTLLMAAATMMTGRRSAVLVAGVGVVAVAWLVFPRRPALLTFAAASGVIVGAFYLNAFWDAQSGPIAEPARAVRSQVDPDARDASSDRYRQIERENIQRTLKDNPFLGVGFGRPFTEYEPLPELTFWPLQRYTTHQNLLWLWLKTGILGVSVLLGLWAVAFKRCLVACRSGRTGAPAPVVPIFFAAALLMYLAYARVDLAFVAARACVPLAVMLALVLMRPWGRVEERP